MNLTIGNKLHGFTITNIREVVGKNAQLIEMCYEKTNTELCWYKSSEVNKLFCIGFKTLPKDDTGVFHILEHSVLAGSENYPTKEPFVDLLKSSMNTFLNAITFSDKTIYPVSSRNEQDFLNLTSVYLDAVFAPLMRKNANIFYQEGWHYEMEDGKLVYNGVVFNEMKGASSSVNTIINNNLKKMVFKDNSYGFVSGGDPEAIPDLTYEGYVNTYNEFYHPTNARIFLDGDIPFDKVLAKIDAYLSKFEMGNKHEIIPQTPVSQEKDMYYETTGEDLSSKAYLSLGKIVCDYSDSVKTLATHILSDVLAGNNDAPLTRAILASGLGQDVTMHINDGVYQPWFSLRVDNINNDNANKVLALIKDTVKDIIEKGIDKKEIIASINSLSFALKEAGEPQGLNRSISALESWLYNGDPMKFLTFDETIASLRKMAETNAFEDLLAELLLDDNGLCILHTLPSLTYGEDVRNKEKARLAKEQSEMSEETLKEVIEKAEKLVEWQKSSNTKEAIATIPVLDLKEVDETPIFTETKEEVVEDVKVLRHDVDTNGIVHMSMYFSLRDFTKEELTQVSFLCNLYTDLSTRNYDSTTLQNEIKTYIGSLHFNVETYADVNNNKDCIPMLVVNMSVLEENSKKAEELVLEILTNTIFDNKERIKEVVLQNEMIAKQYIITGGRNIAMYVTGSHYSSAGVANEVTHGYTYLHWITTFAKNFDTMYEGFMKVVNKVNTSLGRKRLTISVTTSTDKNVTDFITSFPEGKVVNETPKYTSTLPKKMGIKIPAQVSYAVMSHNLKEQNIAYNGSLRLLSHIATFSYLWDEVRVQGGAYGTGMDCARGGTFHTHSYRDPSPERSLDVYRKVSDFMNEFVKEEDLTKYIISTIATTEPLRTPAQQGKIADTLYFSNFTYEDACKERKEILHATATDLTNWSKALSTHAKDGAICVVGYSGALEACAKEELEITEI